MDSTWNTQTFSPKSQRREDILHEIYMPLGPDKLGAQRGQKSHNEAGGGEMSSKKKKKKENRQVAYFRKAYRGDINSGGHETDDKKKLDDKLLEELAECLQHCSRQRLRAVHMSMRQYGNEASGISSKDVITSLQDNKVKIHDRLLKSLFVKFEDSKSIIQLEVLYRFLVEAHSKTGRDSVLAMRKRNDLATTPNVPKEEVDEDLIWRIQALLIKSRSFIDVPELREAFQTRDSQRSGKLETSVASQICFDHQMPVYGALLKNLIRRCDEEKNDKINWPEFLQFLEMGQQYAWKISPDLKDLPAKMKKQTPVEPTILDELSSRTKNTLMSKLRQKASIKKKETETGTKTNSTVVSESNRNAITPSSDKNVSSTSGVVALKGKEKLKTQEHTIVSSTDHDATPLREEPSIGIDKKETLSKGDSKGTVTSVTSGTQVVIDIIPPSKETTLDKSEMSECFGKNDTKTTTEASMLVSDIQKDTNLSSPEKTRTSSSMETDIEVPKHIPEKQTKKQQEESNISLNGLEQLSSKEPVTSADTDDKQRGTETLNVHGEEVTFNIPDYLMNNQTLDPPKQTLEMQWVYGYRGNDCRKNIHVLASGEILYFMSFIAIVYNREKHVQRHYKDHTDEIKCIDVHSDGVTVATGQFASRKNGNIQAHIRIWNSQTLETLHIVGMGEFERAVACLAFSPVKNLLAAVDNSLEKKLSIWDTSTCEKKGEEILHTELICDVGFNKKIPGTVVTIGKNHINWWRVDVEDSMVQCIAKPVYEGFQQAKFVICQTFDGSGNLITGDSDGTIYIWGAGDNRITSHIKHAHDGPVFTVVCYNEYLFSGGRDGILHCWLLNKNMDAAGFLQLPHTEGGIRMLQVFDDSLLLGTTMNSMHVVKLNGNADPSPLTGSCIEATPITQCHYDDLRGLAITSKASGYSVLTAGQDGIICGFDTTKCKAVSKIQIKGKQYYCIDADDTGTIVALGTKDGRVQLLHHESGQWQELLHHKVSKDRLSVIRISPDKKFIASGSHDTNIYLFALQLNANGSALWEYYGKLQGHQTAVNGLDWFNREKNVLVLKSTSVSLEQRFWDPFTKASVREGTLSTKLDWATHTCATDVTVLGALATKFTQETEVEAIDVNPAGNMVAIGDNKSCLSLYRYPCVKSDVNCHSYKSHASVRNMRFTEDGGHLLTVGGRDSCMIQWKVI